MRWRCPACRRWTDAPIGRRCTTCTPRPTTPRPTPADLDHPRPADPTPDDQPEQLVHADLVTFDALIPPIVLPDLAPIADAPFTLEREPERRQSVQPALFS